MRLRSVTSALLSPALLSPALIYIYANVHLLPVTTAPRSGIEVFVEVLLFALQNSRDKEAGFVFELR